MIQEKNLSEDTVSLFKTLKIISIEKILLFIYSNNFQLNGEFYAESIKIDLLEFFLDYVESSNNDGIVLSMPIHLLAIYEKMSQRAYNISQNAGFINLNSIVEYGLKMNGFKKLRNCGKITNEEFIRIYENYRDLYESVNMRSPDRKIKMLKLLDSQSFVDITLQIFAKRESLSARSYNVCKNAHLNSLKSVLKFYLQNEKSQFLQIKNSSVKTNEELVNICRKYENLITSSDENSPKTQISNFLVQSGLLFDYDLVLNNIGKRSGTPLFKILELLIDKKRIFKNKHEVEVFKSCFNCYRPLSNYTFQEIGKKLGISMERVRQIRKNLNNKIEHAFKFINLNHVNDFAEQYKFSDSQPYIYIDPETEFQINSREETKFSSYFITLILSNLFKESHVLFGDLNMVLSKRIFQKSCYEKNIYLINRQITSEFNFKKLHLFLKTKLTDRPRKYEEVSYAYLIKKFANKPLTKPNETIEIINLIAMNDFNNILEIEQDGLVFYRTFAINVIYSLKEILEKRDTPMHFTEIYQHLISTGIKIKSSYVHSILIRESKIFGLKGPGLYDLRSKGGFFGTIGNVTYQHLSQIGEPIHLKDLENFICNHLIVSKNSVPNVLFYYESEHRFMKDKDGYVRLSKWMK